MSQASHPIRVVVIGGGIAGLSAAHRVLELSRQQGLSLQLTLLEAGEKMGGVIRTERRDGFLIETGPDNFVTSKPAAVNLAKRLGIAGQLQNTNAAHRSALVVRGGRLLPIPEGFLLMAPTKLGPIIRTRVFSPLGKLRMALEPLIPARRDHQDESLASFVTRRLGREALDRLVQPLVGGIYSADPDTLSLRATLPRFLEMEAEHGSVIKAMNAARKQTPQPRETGARYSLFVTFRNGLDTLVNALVQQLPPPSVRLNSPVREITRSAEGLWSVTIHDGRTFSADGVIMATPTYHMAKFLQKQDPQLAGDLANVEYASSAVVHFAYQRSQIGHPLDAFGFVVPAVEKRQLMACSFSDVKYPGRSPEGFVLLRTFLGGALQPHLMDLDDQALTAAARADIEQLLDIKGQPRFTLVARWPRSMPQYFVGHLDRVAAIREQAARWQTLELAGSGFEGVGIPDCVHSGEQAAERLWTRLTGSANLPSSAPPSHAPQILTGGGIPLPNPPRPTG